MVTRTNRQITTTQLIEFARYTLKLFIRPGSRSPGPFETDAFALGILVASYILGIKPGTASITAMIKPLSDWLLKQDPPPFDPPYKDASKRTVSKTRQ